MQATVYQAVHKIFRNFTNTIIDPYDCIIFGCGISKLVSPKKQDLWPRINILKGKQKQKLKVDLQLFGLMYFFGTCVHNIFEEKEK